MQTSWKGSSHSTCYHMAISGLQMPDFTNLKS